MRLVGVEGKSCNALGLCHFTPHYAGRSAKQAGKQFETLHMQN